MSEYFYGQIDFLQQSLGIPEVKKVWDTLQSEETFDDTYTKEGVITAYSYQASWGTFPELESVLKAHDQPFSTSSVDDSNEAPTTGVYIPESKTEAAWFVSSIGGNPLTDVNHVVNMLELGRADELLKNLKEKYPVFHIEDYVTEYEGTLAATHYKELDNGITMNTIAIDGYVHYQYKTYEGFGIIHKVKLIAVPIGEDTKYTFFTKEGKQYWIQDLMKVGNDDETL